VPETSLYADDSLIFAQHNIRCAWQPANVYAEPQAASMEIAAYQHFGLGVAASDGSHATVALFGCEAVHDNSASFLS